MLDLLNLDQFHDQLCMIKMVSFFCQIRPKYSNVMLKVWLKEKGITIDLLLRIYKKKMLNNGGYFAEVLETSLIY